MDSRSDFTETWLCEMPEGLGTFETFDALSYHITDRIQHGSVPKILPNGLHVIDGNQVAFYWYETNGEITLGTEIYKKPQGLIISITGKNPKYRGKPPYASNLYNDILNTTNRSIRLFSDIQLSDEGLKIWERLIQMGHKISVYDNSNPGKSFKTINSVSELQAFFKHDDTNFKKYQYVLSETGEVLAETKSVFNTRRYRELSGLL